MLYQKNLEKNNKNQSIFHRKMKDPQYLTVKIKIQSRYYFEKISFYKK